MGKRVFIYIYSGSIEVIGYLDRWDNLILFIVPISNLSVVVISREIYY